MQSRVTHILFNIDGANQPFYRDFLAFVGYQTLYDVPDMLGVGGAGGESLWFASGARPVTNDYDGPGVNHIALSAASQTEVDSVVAYLTERGVPALFETPRHRPDFSESPEHTYYQVMFETPDRILIEVVYTGPLQP